MNRRSFIQTGAMAAAAVSLSGNPLFAKSRAGKLTILHTNDMHSRIDPFPMDGGKWQGLGGMARRAKLIASIRQQEDNVLLVDAGDIWQGTPYFNYFGGEPEYRLMSDMGYEVATLGNHDFDNGLTGLQKQLPKAGFQFVNANYDFSKTILAGSFKPYTILNKKGIMVGIFGLGIELSGLVPDKLYGKTIFHDPLPVAREMVQELKAKKVDLIICLSHLGLNYANDKISDERLAAQVSGIDIIIGGHTHSFLDKPLSIANAGGQTLVNQVGWAGINLGRIDVAFSSSGAGKQMSWANMPVQPLL